MFPGMGPLCTGQGQEKNKRTEGQRRWREAGGRCMGTEEGQVGKKQMQMSNEQKTYLDVDLRSCL